MGLAVYGIGLVAGSVEKSSVAAVGGRGSDCSAVAGTLRFYKYATPQGSIGKKMKSLNTAFVEGIRWFGVLFRF